METLDAAVQEKDAKHFLVIHIESEEIKIPLSDDNPTQVKKAFNRLIVRIREGPIQVRLNKGGEDLFHEVASEYIRQLNKEIQEVRAEMVQHDLVEG